MNHSESEYRATLPHQLHHGQCAAPLQAFSARFPTATSIDGLSAAAVMLPGLNHEDTNGQYHGSVQSFINSTRPPTDVVPQKESQKGTDGRIFECERQQQSQQQHQDPAATGSGGPPDNSQFSRHCNQGAKNCLQCYNKPALTSQNQAATTTRNNKIMVDVSTMTDTDELDQAPNWQSISVTPNTKVAEYLTSLRQFLKLSNPGETKRKLGDVRIVTSPDGSRLYCCPECHMAYPDKSLLEPHLASHKIERRFVCGVCGAGLKRKEHLDRHQLSHSDERPYSCGACPKTFKRNEHLARHYIIHSGEKAQVCNECGKAFYRKDHLRKHAQGHLSKRLRLAAIAT